MARLAPSATRREDGKDAGTNRIVWGPDGWSVVENGRTDGDSGSRNALGIIWGNEKARGFRTMFYDSGDRAGGSVYDGLGKGEANELVFKFRIYSDGNKIDGTELLDADLPGLVYPPVFRESKRGTARCHANCDPYEGRVV